MEQTQTVRYSAPTPQLKRLETIIDKLDSEDGELEGQDYTDIADALKWLHNMLSQRKHYQKKQQLKKNALFQALKKIMDPDELARIEQEATEKAALQKEN